MSAYVELQEAEFAAAKDGYTFVSHQQEVGTGYFDDVAQVIQGGQSSVTALTGSTEEAQFRQGALSKAERKGRHRRPFFRTKRRSQMTNSVHELVHRHRFEPLLILRKFE